MCQDKYHRKKTKQNKKTAFLLSEAVRRKWVVAVQLYECLEIYFRSGRLKLEWVSHGCCSVIWKCSGEGWLKQPRFSSYLNVQREEVAVLLSVWNCRMRVAMVVQLTKTERRDEVSCHGCVWWTEVVQFQHCCSTRMKFKLKSERLCHYFNIWLNIFFRVNIIFKICGFASIVKCTIANFFCFCFEKKKSTNKGSQS